MATLSFIDRVQNLPAEIYNQILDLTFAVDFKATCRIDKDYTPPSILQVSRTLRALLSPVFYKNTTFVVVEDVTAKNRLESLTLWLRSLSPDQLMRATSPELRIFSAKTLSIRRDPRARITLERRDLPSRDDWTVRALQRRVYDELENFPLYGWRMSSAMNVRFRFLTKEGVECECTWFFSRKSNNVLYVLGDYADHHQIVVSSTERPGESLGKCTPRMSHAAFE